MSIITLTGGVFCHSEQLVRALVDQTGHEIVLDTHLRDTATKISGMDAAKFERACSTKTSVFNKFTHEKERAVSWLKLAMAQTIKDRENLLVAGYCALLIPREISHALSVCLVADLPYRIRLATSELGLSEKDAMRHIKKADEDLACWVETLRGSKDPWNAELYDMVIPMGKKGVEEACRMIDEYASKDILEPTEASRQAAADFLLAAQVEVALGGEGHNVNVTADKGVVTLIINKNVLLLHKLEEELASIASNIDGVKDVRTTVGKGFHQTDIYRKYDFETPSKVLLVDDEREFVETLSERLMMREMGSAVVYDGESALDLISRDEPEVMILDLKMPGIDGIEVLRRVKESNPDIEVIILTGHGSETDRETCMKLGAFDYLHKPVDIEKLSAALKAANEKIKSKKAAR